MALLAPQDELENLSARATVALEESLFDASKAVLAGDLRAERSAIRRAGEQVAAAQGLADLLGRRRVWLEVDHVRGHARSKEPHRAAYAMTSVYSPVIPHVPFREAIQELVEREPRLASGANEVLDLYGDRHAFAIARALDLTVVRRVQKSIEKVLAEGADLQREVAATAKLEGWTKAYAGTVYRTNLSTSYTGGRFRQAQDPDVEDTIVGLRRVAVLDSNCRANHRRAHGFVAGQHDPAWAYMAPPWGYNERCGMELVDRFTAAREGLLVNGRLPRGVPRSAPDKDFVTGGTFPRAGAYAAPALRLAPVW